MGKRQIAALETKRRLIAAAEKLINERGFEAVGVSDIAAEAGVAKGSFYTYFKRKEDVVAEIALLDFISVEEQATAVGDVCGQISLFLKESMRYIVDTGVNICQQWLKNVVEPDDKQGVGKLSYDKGVIRSALSCAAKRGELKADTPVEALTDIIVTEYYGAVAVWAITNGAYDPVEGIRTYCDTAMRQMLAEHMA